MKKILFLCAAVLLLAAGCGAKTSQVIPKGAETSYKQVINEATKKCGNDIHLEYFSVGQAVQKDSYYFTAGKCGNGGQIITVMYDRSAKSVNVDTNASDDTSHVLQAIPLGDWNISSQNAIKAALAAGGQDFLNKNKNSSIKIVGLSFRQRQSFRWEVTFSTADGLKQMSIFLDPKTGNKIDG